MVTSICGKSSKLLPPDVTILRLKCTKFDFGWGGAPDPAGELTALPRPPSWILGGLLLKGGEGKGSRIRQEKGRDTGEEGKGSRIHYA
jgi:hypothetical protein